MHAVSEEKTQGEPEPPYEVDVIVFASNEAGTPWIQDWLDQEAFDGWRVQSTTATNLPVNEWGDRISRSGPSSGPKGEFGSITYYQRLPTLAFTLIRTTATKTNTTHQEREERK